MEVTQCWRHCDCK